MTERVDVVVIGAGIVGLSTAWAALERFPRLRLVVLEKEGRVAAHQSGHNSGVIHSGLYYKPGSHKARMCVTGAAAMLEFCRVHRLPHAQCGKLVVAVMPDEVAGLRRLHERGLENGLDGLRLLSSEQAREIEPHCSCIAALHVPGTAITDYAAVSRKYAELAHLRGGQVCTGSEVVAISQHGSELVVRTRETEIQSSYLINCAGLHSDRIMRMAGQEADFRIVPFRGEYYELGRPELVRALIYPVPDPRFPFLGVHFTRRVTGGVEAGPNAVLSLKREGYSRSDFSLRDRLDALAWPGLWRLGLRHWRTEVDEFPSADAPSRGRCNVSCRSWKLPIFARADRACALRQWHGMAHWWTISFLWPEVTCCTSATFRLPPLPPRSQSGKPSCRWHTRALAWRDLDAHRRGSARRRCDPLVYSPAAAGIDYLRAQSTLGRPEKAPVPVHRHRNQDAGATLATGTV
jgi:(S)-2-hydroxyglutarate dehydrogenase